jgi:hypothetical protein
VEVEAAYNVPNTIGAKRRNRIMASDKKNEANRRNASKSTGPKTPEGKAAIRLNALKHGLLSQEVLLPGEDGEAFRALGENLRAELQPVGQLENLLVDRIIVAYWRLLRAGRVEAGMFAGELYEQLAERAEREAKDYKLSSLDELIADEEDATITDKKKHKEAVSRARQMRRAQETEIITLGRTFLRDADRANAFSKLSRYETAIDRQLYKALHELERLQVARHGGDVPTPQVVDVDVSGLPEGDR